MGISFSSPKTCAPCFFPFKAFWTEIDVGMLESSRVDYSTTCFPLPLLPLYKRQQGKGTGGSAGVSWLKSQFPQHHFHSAIPPLPPLEAPVGGGGNPSRELAPPSHTRPLPTKQPLATANRDCWIWLMLVWDSAPLHFKCSKSPAALGKFKMQSRSPGGSWSHHELRLLSPRSSRLRELPPLQFCREVFID